MAWRICVGAAPLPPLAGALPCGCDATAAVVPAVGCGAAALPCGSVVAAAAAAAAAGWDAAALLVLPGAALLLPGCEAPSCCGVFVRRDPRPDPMPGGTGGTVNPHCVYPGALVLFLKVTPVTPDIRRLPCCAGCV